MYITTMMNWETKPDFKFTKIPEIQNYLLPHGFLGPRAMIHRGPWALGLGSITDVFIHGEF